MKYIILFLLTLLAGCNSGPTFETKSAWLVHNPTAHTVTVKIDGKAIQLASQKSQELTLEAGKHTIDTPLTGAQEFVVYVNAKGGLINPTLSTYVIEPINYVREGESVNADFWGPMKKIITLDGVSFEGMYKVHNDLLIDKDWAYAPGEKIPDEISTYDPEPRNEIRNKIYTKAEFFEMMDAKPLQADPITQWKMPELPSAPKFESEKLEKASQAYRTAQNEYYLSTDPKRQIEIQQSQMELMRPLIDVYAASAMNLSKQDMETYTALAGAQNYRGARVLPKAK